MYVCMCVCMYVCIYTCIFMYVYIYIYIYTCIYTCVYIHTSPKRRAAAGLPSDRPSAADSAGPEDAQVAVAARLGRGERERESQRDAGIIKCYTTALLNSGLPANLPETFRILPGTQCLET